LRSSAPLGEFVDQLKMTVMTTTITSDYIDLQWSFIVMYNGKEGGRGVEYTIMWPSAQQKQKQRT
jgi:hypothetical protein